MNELAAAVEQRGDLVFEIHIACQFLTKPSGSRSVTSLVFRSPAGYRMPLSVQPNTRSMYSRGRGRPARVFQAGTVFSETMIMRRSYSVRSLSIGAPGSIRI